MKLLARPKPKFPSDPHSPELVREPGEECLATFWQQITPGTTYWRCLVPARRLPGQSIPLTPLDLQEDPKSGKIWFPRQRGGAAIWQFLGDAHRTKVALAMRSLLGTKLILEVDDNYTRPAPYMRGRADAHWKKTIAEAGTGYSNEAHRIIAPAVDHIICATEYLANVYEQFNPNVTVCPNSIDPDDWQYEREEHDAFRIVYYGSSSHVVDAPLVTDALKWASRQPGVEVWTVGFKVPSWSFEYQTVPWKKDLAEARQELFRFDVGVAPLKGNPWSRGKSDVKATEYAMAGVMPIVQDETPYEYWKGAGWDWVCKTKGDWMEAIQEIVRNRDEAPKFAAQAKELVMTERTIDVTIDLWRSALA